MFKYFFLFTMSLCIVSCSNSEQSSTSVKEEIAELTKLKEAPKLKVLSGASIEMIDPALSGVIDTQAKIEVLAEGHEWTEGPLWVESHQMLLYNDIPRNAIYQWTELESAQVYLKPSGFTGKDFTGREPGSNGLLLDKNGSLVMCQHGDRRIARMETSIDAPKSQFTTISDNYNGMRLNSPNDAVFSKSGDIYFTDPPYGLPGQMDDPEKETPYQGVYRIDQNGKTHLLTDEFTRPNGIAFSPDEKILYIANSDPEKAIWKSFDVNADGSISNGKLFYDATKNVPNSKGLPDGLKVNNNGTIFATGPGGVYIFSPDATLLGIIRTGEATSNCALNADHSVLYVTADMYVLRVALNK